MVGCGRAPCQHLTPCTAAPRWSFAGTVEVPSGAMASRPSACRQATSHSSHSIRACRKFMSPIIFTASSYVPASTMAPFTSCQAALFTGRWLGGGGRGPWGRCAVKVGRANNQGEQLRIKACSLPTGSTRNPGCASRPPHRRSSTQSKMRLMTSGGFFSALRAPMSCANILRQHGVEVEGLDNSNMAAVPAHPPGRWTACPGPPGGRAATPAAHPAHQVNCSYPHSSCKKAPRQLKHSPT